MNDVLEERGFIKQTTHEGLKEKLAKEKVTFYIGFDPTADSLHVGPLCTVDGDGAHATRRTQADCVDRRRHGDGGRPQRAIRYAEHAD